MKLFLTFLLATLLCLQANAWVGRIKSQKSDQFHCYTTAHDIGGMEVNETVRIKNMCAEAVCQEDTDIKLRGCAPIIVEPPCYEEKGDMNKPFPQCCFEIRCPEIQEVYPKKPE